MVDVSFERHIRPLFRDFDIQQMRNAPFVGFDLTDVSEVKLRAEAIYEKLTAKNSVMPCDGSWPSEWISLFRRWIDEGMSD